MRFIAKQLPRLEGDDHQVRQKLPDLPKQYPRNMSMTKQIEQHEGKEPQQREALDTPIQLQILHTLGSPDHLIKVQVRQLWTNHYRVNVYVGLDAASAKVANSYFLVVDGEGTILTSNPKITRHYGAVGEGRPSVCPQ
jgi:hypothetical protein